MYITKINNLRYVMKLICACSVRAIHVLAQYLTLLVTFAYTLLLDWYLLQS